MQQNVCLSWCWSLDTYPWNVVVSVQGMNETGDCCPWINVKSEKWFHRKIAELLDVCELWNICERFRWGCVLFEDWDPLGAVLLTNYTLSKANDVSRPHCFKLSKFSARTYIFQAESEASMTLWAEKIQQAMTHQHTVRTRFICIFQLQLIISRQELKIWWEVLDWSACHAPLMA